jgi:hypothetical protein
MSKEMGNVLNPNKQKLKRVHQDTVFGCARYEALEIEENPRK